MEATYDIANKSILPHVETGCVIRKNSEPVTRGNHKRQQLEAAYNVIRQNIAPAIRGNHNGRLGQIANNSVSPHAEAGSHL